MYVEAAIALGRRLLRERPDAPLDDQLRYAWRLCLARNPDQAELAVLRQLHAAQTAAAEADRTAAKKLLDQFGPAAGESSVPLVAWYAIATALLNLDESITKN